MPAQCSPCCVWAWPLLTVELATTINKNSTLSASHLLLWHQPQHALQQRPLRALRPRHPGPEVLLLAPQHALHCPRGPLQPAAQRGQEEGIVCVKEATRRRASTCSSLVEVRQAGASTHRSSPVFVRPLVPIGASGGGLGRDFRSSAREPAAPRRAKQGSGLAGPAWPGRPAQLARRPGQRAPAAPAAASALAQGLRHGVPTPPWPCTRPGLHSTLIRVSGGGKL